MKYALGLGLLLATLAMPASAGTLTVTIKGINSNFGQIRITVCKAEEFENQVCDLKQLVAAVPGEISVQFPNIEAGAYAIKAYHDQNDNNKLDRGLFGLIPTEGYAFSRIQGKLHKAPAFTDAAIPVGQSETIQELTIAYP